MLIQSWYQVFQLSLQGLWYGFVATVPKIILAIVIFIIGWIVASTLGKLVTTAIDALKLDRVVRSAGAEDVFNRAGWRLHIGGVIGWLVKWLIILAFFTASINLLGLDQVSLFLGQIVAYIPQVIIAVLILVVGTLLADFARKVVAGSAAAAGVRSARMIGSIAYYAIWVLAIVTALDKLGIFGYFGQVIFTGIVLMFAVAFGLAFGLGGKDAAARWINRVSEDLSTRSHNQ
jgi:hypothetical protein